MYGYPRGNGGAGHRAKIIADQIMATEAHKRSPYQRSIARWRVPLGFLLGLTCLFFAAPRAWSIAAGGSIALTGLFWRAWASGHVRKNEKLATSGPYAHSRNPLYFGSFLLGAGFSLATARLELAGIFVIFFLSVYWPVMRREADYMTNLFPDEYQLYANNVPLFWPRLRRWPAAAQLPFDWQLYLRYREYRALLGMAAALALLVAKIYWLPANFFFGWR
jgi:protein-S-isoprenylcysteine O-methyltransferase Ste14